MLTLMLLAAQIMKMGMDNIPPVTVVLVLGQVAVFLDFVPQYFGTAASVCMSSHLVWQRGDWKRMFLSQLFHVDDRHLYFNMASLLLKGRSLERRFGSAYFLWMVAVFTALTSVGYIAISLFLEEYLHDHSYATQCAVGFSGMLFALKVVMTRYGPGGPHRLLGFIPVPSGMVCWAELLLIQLITPNAAFTGHLAGILVGLLYTKGPLKPLMDRFIAPTAGSRTSNPVTMRRSRRGGNLGVMLLGAQIVNMGVNNIPPVTLALVLGQVAVFLDYVPQYFGTAASVCMSSYLVWQRRDWKRMFLSQLFHADDMHLYFNMASLLLKGRSLERRFGSVYFLWMVAVFTALTSVGYIAISLFLEEYLHDHSYATQCAVGFSGVLFALKVVTTHYAPAGLHFILGFIPVPSRMIYWAELLLIQLITPNASFTGHLAGILVGLLYIKGPLKPLMDCFVAPTAVSRFTGGGQTTGYRSRGYSSATTGDGYSSSSGWEYTQYTGGISEEEQYRRAMEESRQQNAWSQPPQPSPGGLYPDLEELRERRAAHYM